MISNILQNSIYDALKGIVSPEAALHAAQKKIEALQ
jgi:hypothetical protein